MVESPIFLEKMQRTDLRKMRDKKLDSRGAHGSVNRIRLCPGLLLLAGRISLFQFIELLLVCVFFLYLFIGIST